MVQVDVFWSYGLASGLALAGREQLRREATPFDNRVFTGMLLWIALLFAPSGVYLLWAFPSWETMFVAPDHAAIPAWLVALFALTNVSQAVLGFYVTWRCLRAGRDRVAWLQTIGSHAAMLFVLVVGWDGTGIQRFTYTGTAADFATGVAYPWRAFIGSPVFVALAVMGLVLVPSYAWLCRAFARMTSAKSAYSTPKAPSQQPAPSARP